MTTPAKLGNGVRLENSIPEGGASLESILCTEELQRRPYRPPDHARENRALVALATALADSPNTILQTLAETILDATGSDSSGLSLLTTYDEGKRFYWPAIAGIWKPHIGRGTPRDFGPCGDVLDRNRTLLFKHFERRYPYLLPVMPAAEECLLVPFYVGGKAVGTIWAIMHSHRRRFDAEDERLMNVLGQFASTAYQTVESIRKLGVQIAAREKGGSGLLSFTGCCRSRCMESVVAQDNIVPTVKHADERRFEQIIGKSPALESVLAKVECVASTDATVLVLGETGTGKELIARAIHKISPRCGHPFVKLNCAAIPFDLLESELFGHEKGAFTGAVVQNIGRFEMADTGTLFLDEIGDIPLALQPKLLRVLQEQEFERLGSGKTHRINVRLVAATHRDLSAMVKQNEFRSDLYYRLSVFPVRLPPLRERRQDIAPLVSHFIEIFSRQLGKQIDYIADETLNAFTSYAWPGNVRELQNAIERAVILSNNGVLPNPLPRSDDSSVTTINPVTEIPVIRVTFEDSQRASILQALQATSWIIGGPAGAAVRLGLKRTTLIAKMRKLGISRPLGRETLGRPSEDALSDRGKVQPFD